ncbi:MAG: thiamine phosphate synthase [Rikenellaceae bacterium]
MKVIVITQPHDVEDEKNLIIAALEAGACRVHIRKPSWSRQQYLDLVGSIPQEFWGRITLHDHFDLCAEFVDVGLQANGRNPQLPPLFEGVTSCSCHSIEELKGAQKFDYVTLSPIYDSISKGGYLAAFSRTEITAAKREGLISGRVVAMGGITPDLIPELHDMGFGGVALLGYVWQDETVEGVSRRVQKAVKMARMSETFSLQYITHRNEKLNDIEGAQAAIDGGCRWVQLRMKGFSDDEFVCNGHTLREVCHKAGATFLLNDRVELVGECGADGVHIGKGDMTPIEARAILGEGAIIGGTANSCDDIDYLVAQGVDYIGLGPFRFTTTKEKLSPTLGLDGYTRVVEHCRQRGYRTPIVAIGGITTADIAPIMERGVDGIALSGTILNAEDSVATTSDIVKILFKVKI